MEFSLADVPVFFKAVAIFALLAIAWTVVTSEWFWAAAKVAIILGLLLTGLAACFTMIASIIHFQILAAVGYFVAMVVIWGIAFAIFSR